MQRSSRPGSSLDASSCWTPVARSSISTRPAAYRSPDPAAVPVRLQVEPAETVVAPGGSVRFYRDIYARDADLLNALNAADHTGGEG